MVECGALRYESRKLFNRWDRLLDFAPFTFIAVFKVCTKRSTNPLEEGWGGGGVVWGTSDMLDSILLQELCKIV